MLKIIILQTTFTIINNPNPIIILITIIAFTIIISLIIFIITLNYWISIFIIITYIGGLIILFLYVISLLPNSKQKWSNLNKIINSSLIIIIIWSNLTIIIIKLQLKNISISYLNNLWRLIFILIIILLITQIASKTIFLPFKIIKSTY